MNFYYVSNKKNEKKISISIIKMYVEKIFQRQVFQKLH